MIRKAERRNVRAKIMLMAPSGGGKTYSALKLAGGLVAPGGKIGMIDTEERRGEYYANEFNYDVFPLSPPYSPERYIEAMREFQKEGYDVLITDSGSHEWMGRGGIMEELDKMPGSSFQKWGKLTPRHNAFIDAIIRCDMHVIFTCRAKDQYVVEENDRGKQAPKKVGVGPQQREGLEYEMTVTLLLDQKTHIAEAVKDNTHVFEGKYDVLTEEHGRLLRAWTLSGGNSSPGNESHSENEEGMATPPPPPSRVMPSSANSEKPDPPPGPRMEPGYVTPKSETITSLRDEVRTLVEKGDFSTAEKAEFYTNLGPAMKSLDTMRALKAKYVQLADERAKASA